MVQPMSAAPESARVTRRRDGAIATVTQNNPDWLNVLEPGRGGSALGRGFRGRLADGRLGALRGAPGGREAGSSRPGSDIGGFGSQRSTPEQVARYAAAVERGISGVRDCPHPTVAVVEGLCVGGGMILAACCDIAVCGESSRFGAPINRLGLTMAYEEMAPLLAAAGPRAVLETSC